VCRDGVRRIGNDDCRQATIFAQARFEFCDDFSGKYVFNGVGVTINVIGRDCGVRDEVHLPQAVRAHDCLCLLATFGRERDTVSFSRDQSASHGMTKQRVKFGGRPSTLEGDITDWYEGRLLGFLHFKYGTQDVLQ
jgi:hypothetical protein